VSAARADWRLGSVVIAGFVLLVATLLGLVLAWSDPFLAWLVLGMVVQAALALHALVRGACAAWRRRWRATLAAAGLALVFAAGVVSLPVLGWVVLTHAAAPDPEDAAP